MWIRPLAAVAAALALALAPSLLAQPSNLVRDHEAALKQFGEETKKAREQAVKAFDAVISKTENNRAQPASVRVTRVEQLKKAKAEFETNSKWPDDEPALLADEWKYVGKLNQQYQPVSRSFERLIDTAKGDAAKEWVARKTKFEEQFPGRSFFTGDSKWHGTLHRGGGSETLHLNVAKVEGTVFQADVHLHPEVPGHALMEVGGTVDGLMLTFSKSADKRGKVKLAFAGMISGNRVLLQAFELPTRKPVGYAVLDHVKK
jgi:hypothetical protein